MHTCCKVYESMREAVASYWELSATIFVELGDYTDALQTFNIIGALHKEAAVSITSFNSNKSLNLIIGNRLLHSLG